VADEPLDIDELKGNVAATFAKYESLVIGTPTWNTGADTERSGTAWDYELCKQFHLKQHFYLSCDYMGKYNC